MLLCLELHTHISSWVLEISSRMWNTFKFIISKIRPVVSPRNIFHISPYSVRIHNFPVAQAPQAIHDCSFSYHSPNTSEIPVSPNLKMYELPNTCILPLLLSPQMYSDQGFCYSFLTDTSATTCDLLQFFPQNGSVILLKYQFEFVTPLLKLCHDSPFH